MGKVLTVMTMNYLFCQLVFIVYFSGLFQIVEELNRTEQTIFPLLLDLKTHTHYTHTHTPHTPHTPHTHTYSFFSTFLTFSVETFNFSNFLITSFQRRTLPIFHHIFFLPRLTRTYTRLHALTHTH
jgi:hypothetical protein